jgi:hypothetical protein
MIANKQHLLVCKSFLRKRQRMDLMAEEAVTSELLSVHPTGKNTGKPSFEKLILSHISQELRKLLHKYRWRHLPVTGKNRDPFDVPG